MSQQQPHTQTKKKLLIEDMRSFSGLFTRSVIPLNKEKLLDDICLDPRLFSEYVRLISTDESLLTHEGILLRNTFLQICPNIPNLL